MPWYRITSYNVCYTKLLREDLFRDDPPLTLPIIKGLDEYVPQEEFFDDALMERIDEAEDKTSDKENKAARNIPKPIRNNFV